MEKKELQKELDGVIKQIKTNSKDAHFADALIDKALSLKGQLGVDPIELDMGTRVKEIKGDTYELVETTMGIWYHQYGGYNIFVKAGTNNALYETLSAMFDLSDMMKDLDSKEKNAYDLAMSAATYCLILPTICFVDEDFTFNIASQVVDFIREQYDKEMNKPLQKETPKENEEFEQATKSLEEIKEGIKEQPKE